METLIETKDVSFYYNFGEENQSDEILHGVSLSIPKGQFIAVLGHNGSGKSTLAKHFNAIYLPSGGTVYVDGLDTLEEDKLFEIRRRIGMVFQNPDNQLVATVVEEDVAFALENLGVPPDEIRRRVDEALQTVRMSDYAKHAPHQLSGGQKQRVAIAGVLAMAPSCIVFDEPTAMLDPQGRREVMDTILDLSRQQGTTIVMITHYMDEAALADRVVVMDDGRILLDGVPRKVFADVELMKSVGLDVPQVTDLSFRLRQKGIPLPADVLTPEEFADALVAYLEGAPDQGGTQETGDA